MNFEEKPQNREYGSKCDYQMAKEDQVRACLESKGKRGLFFKSKHLTLMDPVNQVLCPTICVAQILRCHFSPTIYVKLFALSSLISYVNVACFHCLVCADMFNWSTLFAEI